MPNLASIVKRFTDTKALYFAKEEMSDAFGQSLYSAPQEVLVRWEDTQKNIILPDGRIILSKGYILLSTKVEAGGLFWKGTKVQWQAKYGSSTPTQAQGSREIVLVKDTPGMKQLKGNVYEAYI